MYCQELLVLEKNPEVKVRRRGRGYARLKYIVWESSFVMQQRAVVRFLILKKLSAREITAELEGLYGYEALSFGCEEVAQAVGQWECLP
jgi:hypothetical protein